MTKDQYLMMCEQTGEEVDWEKCPPDWEDFPEIVGLSVQCFNNLGDRVYPEIGYVGKDYTSLPLYMATLGIDKHEEAFFLEILEWLDARAIKKSAEDLKRQYDKLKRKK